MKTTNNKTIGVRLRSNTVGLHLYGEFEKPLIQPLLTLVATMKDLTDRALVGWRILLIVLFFNMLVCAYSGHVGWMLFWAIAFSSGVHEHGYEYGKTEERLRRIGGFTKI